jgi:hypothetical protein
MCFSPSISFGASAVLTSIGVTSIFYARTFPQRVLACIPIIFAVQQFSEGILWIALLNPVHNNWEKPAAYTFLNFAQVVWPIFMPLCMLLFERDAKRKVIMSILLLAGITLGAYLFYCLFTYPIKAIAQHHHIRYDLGFALSTAWYFGLLYFIPTIIAPMFSSVKRMPLLGYLFLGSYIISRLLFHFYVISVWCFFGAVISIVVLSIIIRSRRPVAALAQ